ncbi:MAG: hypothetical protein B7Z42_08170 [Brevundimonas sp. 12-68-7]|nr:MAG: hypothetical protein B7Z42_08170 [Brevundimonas sp. 12-68-7]
MEEFQGVTSESVSLAFDKSCQAFTDAAKTKGDVERHLSLSHTLRKVDGILNGWGKHYRFCNDVRTLNELDKRVSELIRSYLGRYGEVRNKADPKQWRSLLGIASLSMIERTPLDWPRTTRAN